MTNRPPTPRLLILVSPGRRHPIPITAPQDWVGTACGRCERRIDREPTVFLENEEVRCLRCLGSRVTAAQCLWCGREPARVQDTGFRLCQPCWAIYVAYVADQVEPDITPFKQLLTDVRTTIKEERARAIKDREIPAPPDEAPGQDRPSGDR